MIKSVIKGLGRFWFLAKLRFMPDDYIKSYLRRLGHHVRKHEQYVWEYGLLVKELGRRSVSLDDSLNWCRARYESSDVHFSKAIPRTVSLDDFHRLASSRQSIRFYRKEKVPLKLVHRILECGVEAPSSCNRQSWGMKLVTGQDDLDFLARERKLGFISKASATVVVLANKESYENKLLFRRDEKKYTPYMDASMLSQNILLAATASGVGSCIVNMGEVEVPPRVWKRIFRRLGIPSKYLLVCLITLGYPEKIPPRPKRNSHEEYLVK